MCQQGISVVQGAGAPRGGRVPEGMCGRSQACRAGAGRADSLAHRSGRIRKLVWRVSRATDAPLLGTRLPCWGRGVPSLGQLAAPVGGARVPMGLASLAPPRGASVMPATHGCPRHARTAWWRLPRKKGGASGHLCPAWRCGRSPRHVTARACTSRAMAPGPPRGPGPSSVWEFLEGRLRHAGVPGRVAQFQPIATGSKIQFPPGEDPFLPMIQVLDPDLPLPKHLAGPDEGLRAHGE